MNKIIIISLILLIGCTKNNLSDTDGGNDSNHAWLIPLDRVIDGGPGKDGIPSIDNPIFNTIGNTTNLADEELVLVSRSDDEVKIYPHQILNWHEIVNDINGKKVLSIIYCPLTGSGMAWNRVLISGTTSFGVSGLLYNNNVIPYDRASDSKWSQLRMDCINGDLIGTFVDVFSLLETSYSTAKEMFPDALILSRKTGYTRSYDAYPYIDYRESDDIFFPGDNLDNRLHEKERVLTVMDESFPLVYRFDSFQDSTHVIESTYRGKEYIVVGNSDLNYMAAFFMPPGSASFVPIQNSVGLVMEDKSGNKYDIFGKVVEGPDKGMKLRSPINYIAYWFSIGAIYQDVEIYLSE